MRELTEEEILKLEHKERSEQIKDVALKTGWNDESHYHPGISRPALMGGPGSVVSNGITIELGRHYNGSGPSSFGGARSWPHLKAEIAFPVGDEQQARELMVKIAALIDEEIPWPEEA